MKQALAAYGSDQLLDHLGIAYNKIPANVSWMARNGWYAIRQQKLRSRGGLETICKYDTFLQQKPQARLSLPGVAKVEISDV